MGCPFFFRSLSFVCAEARRSASHRTLGHGKWTIVVVCAWKAVRYDGERAVAKSGFLEDMSAGVQVSIQGCEIGAEGWWKQGDCGEQ